MSLPWKCLLHWGSWYHLVIVVLQWELWWSVHRSLRLPASEPPVYPRVSPCLSSRWDDAHRLFRVRWWSVLLGEAWHHGASCPGSAISCNTLAHPGGHGRRHETFISSENCTYVELIKMCFMWVATWTMALNWTKDISLLTRSLGYSPKWYAPKIIHLSKLQKIHLNCFPSLKTQSLDFPLVLGVQNSASFRLQRPCVVCLPGLCLEIQSSAGPCGN